MCSSHCGYILTRISKNNEDRKLTMAIVGESVAVAVAVAVVVVAAV